MKPKAYQLRSRCGLSVDWWDGEVVIACLINRLELVSLPDRATDRVIFEEVALDGEFTTHNAESWFCSVDYHYGFNTKDGHSVFVGSIPAYTGSIDTARTILPNDYSAELTISAAPASSPELQFTRCRLWDWRRGPLAIDRANEWKSEGNRPLPINILIAGLKARITAGE